MPIDSATSLLFAIGAETDDADANIARFRTLFGTSLGQMSSQFDDWTTKILGDVSTVGGAVTAGASVIAAGLVAAGAVALESAHKYSEYVDEVSRGSRATGISAENMSRLHFAAEATHTSYDALVTGLTRFASTIVKAADGSEQQRAAFQKLGITQEQLKAGEKDMMPLLMTVADRFKALGSRVLQTAEARELFSRGGGAMVTMLSQGSEGLRELFGEAERLGQVIGIKDVEANEKYKASMHLMHVEIEAVAVTIGRDVLPKLTSAATVVMGLALGLKDALEKWNWKDTLTLGVHAMVMAGAYGREEADKLKITIDELAASLSKFGETGTDLVPPAKAAKEEWHGLSELLEKVGDKSANLTDINEKLFAEMAKINAEVGRATAKYQEMHKAGKLTAEDDKEQAAALQAMGAALDTLGAHLLAVNRETVEGVGADLAKRIAAQQRQTFQGQVHLWNEEIKELKAKYQKEGTLTAENLALLSALQKAGWQKLGDDQAEIVKKAGEQLDEQIAQQRGKTYEDEVAAWNKQIDTERDEYAKKNALTDEIEAKLEEKRRAGWERIDREQALAYEKESRELAQHLESIRKEHQTSEERIIDEYQVEAQRYSKEEEEKALKTAQGEARRLQIMQQYEALRKALYQKEQQDLQQLHNSQGWQGVFGRVFEQEIRGNEALMHQWATSTNQSAMIVKVTLEGLKEQAQKTFEQFAQGMGSGIADALVYHKSIKQAMEAALKATLESLAAQALTYAIYSTALGFTRLAEQDYVSAASAFTAAAIWGSVGVAAGIAGGAIPGGQGGGSGGAGSGSSGASGGSSTANSAFAAQNAGGSPPPPGQGGSGQHVTLNVYGHVYGTSGVEQLLGMMNDAVLNRDATLTATNTKTGVQVTK